MYSGKRLFDRISDITEFEKDMTMEYNVRKKEMQELTPWKWKNKIINENKTEKLGSIVYNICRLNYENILVWFN